MSPKLIIAAAALSLLAHHAIAQQSGARNPAGSPVPGLQRTPENQTLTPEEHQNPWSSGPTTLQSSCHTDYLTHCSGNEPGAAIAVACLRQYWNDLTVTCREAIDQYTQQTQGQDTGNDQTDNNDNN
jgi:hypothetical protein